MLINEKPTELPKLCEEQENINPAKLDYLMPWLSELQDEYKKLTADKVLLIYRQEDGLTFILEIRELSIMETEKLKNNFLLRKI